MALQELQLHEIDQVCGGVLSRRGAGMALGSFGLGVGAVVAGTVLSGPVGFGIASVFGLWSGGLAALSYAHDQYSGSEGSSSRGGYGPSMGGYGGLGIGNPSSYGGSNSYGGGYGEGACSSGSCGGDGD